MIDTKLLKTNRWFDEEFLQARMTNACFNGGGGGNGGGRTDAEGSEVEITETYRQVRDEIKVWIKELSSKYRG